MPLPLPAIINALYAVLPLILLSLLIGLFGKDRSFGFWGNFIASLLLTPIVGLLLVLAQTKPEKKVKSKEK